MVKKIILILTFIGFAFLHKVTAQKIITDQYDDSLGIVFRVEAQPDFNKESTKGLLKYINENIREVIIPEGDSRVVVQFLVDTLGYTSDHKIIRGINSLMFRS